MKNTSLGYHTFSQNLKMNSLDFSIVEGDFIRYADNHKKDISRYPIEYRGVIFGWKYVYSNDKGIQWRLCHSQSKNGYEAYGVTAIINPKVLIENNYIHAAQADDLTLVKKIFNKRKREISEHLPGFEYWYINRADYCLNIDTEELGLPCTAEQLMKLVKRANIPKHLKERKIYDDISHRQKSDPNSFYLQSKSVTINYYRKYSQQSEKHPNYANRGASFNVIRFEVQCMYPKLYAILKKHNPQNIDSLHDSDESLDMYDDFIATGFLPPTLKPDFILSDAISLEILENYIYKIIRKGDYFTFEGAIDIIKSYNFRLDKEKRLIYALEVISDARGIAAAKEKLPYVELDDFKRSLNDLDEILVNPVTIPRKWGIKHIANPFRAYYDTFYEQLITKNEHTALQHIYRYLSDI